MLLDNKTRNGSPASTGQELAIAALLILLIVASRWLIDLPNFKPVMAVAMFAGVIFHRRMIAAGTVIFGMLVSDALLGFYEPVLVGTVYLSMLCPIVAGWVLKRFNSSWSMAAGTVGFSGLAAINFFFWTTLSVWMFTGWYASTWAGLVEAFWMGLPFLKLSIAGNIFFSTFLFGCFAVFQQAQAIMAGQRDRCIVAAGKNRC